MPRQRAPKACLKCRERKIKCTVSNTGIPCDNCSRAKVQCSVNYARKSRKVSTVHTQVVPITSVHTFAVETSNAPLSEHISDNTSTGRDPPVIGATILSPVDQCQTTPPVVRSPTTALTLPSYIAPLRRNLDQDVFQLLHRKGALSIPQLTVREHLIRAYIFYVHPFLPLLDLEEFLQVIDHKGGSKNVSLILFQAVMFAATTFVDIVDLENEGFTSRKEARKAFFDRVRFLYDADVETDSLTLIQVLVLMTYWYDKPADIKGRSHWMRIALSIASDIGLIQQPILTTLTTSQQRLRRRLWWCCLMRDELISFSERRPSGIPWDETDFPTLSIDDFDCSAPSAALQKYFAPDNGMQSKILTLICIQKIKLCVLIGRVLHTQYRLSGHRRTTAGESTVLLVPKLSCSASSEYMARDQELREWGEDTCSILKPVVQTNPRSNGTPVAVHCAVLELLYHTVLGMVHRPQILNGHIGDSAASALQDFSRRTLTESAQRISEIADFLQTADFIRFLPPIGLTALLFAAMQHVKDIMSSSPTVRSTAQGCLDRTLDIMIQLQGTYPQASHAVTFLELVRSKQLKPPDENQVVGEKTIFSFFRNEATHYAPQEVTNRDQATVDVSNGRASSTSESGYQIFGGASHAMTTSTDKVSMDYSRHKPFDFESLLNFDDVSEVFLSGNLDAADFEGVNWAEIFQERNWDA